MIRCTKEVKKTEGIGVTRKLTPKDRGGNGGIRSFYYAPLGMTKAIDGKIYDILESLNRLDDPINMSLDKRVVADVTKNRVEAAARLIDSLGELFEKHAYKPKVCKSVLDVLHGIANNKYLFRIPGQEIETGMILNENVNGKEIFIRVVGYSAKTNKITDVNGYRYKVLEGKEPGTSNIYRVYPSKVKKVAKKAARKIENRMKME